MSRNVATIAEVLEGDLGRTYDASRGLLLAAAVDEGHREGITMNQHREEGPQ